MARESRRLVTVLFCDIVDSTVLGEHLDPETLRALLDRYFAAMSAILVRHGGALEKYIGDAIVAVFGLPLQREDDALRAVRAALEMRDTLIGSLGHDLRATFGVSVRARVGIETGEVSGGAPTPGQRMVTGDTVNTAARLQGLADQDGIVVGPETASLVRGTVLLTDLGPVALKGKAEAIRPARVDGIAGPATRGHGGRFVGRDPELGRILEVAQQVRATRTPGLLLLAGDAGMGKSRLAEEALARMAPDATILRGRCLSYGSGITWWAIAEIVRAAAGIEEGTAEPSVRAHLARLVAHAPDADRLSGRLASLLGLDAAVGVIAELSLAVRVMLEGLAVAAPVAVLVEDLHWAEQGLLDLVQDAVVHARGPILVLATARRSFGDDHPGWPDHAARATRVDLHPLSDAASRQVLEDALSGHLPEHLASRLEAAAEGNPLFLQQLMASLVDDGHLVPRGSGWRLAAPLETLAIPTSIRALLGARLERLDVGDRGIVEGASVAGQVFAEEAARMLAPQPLRRVVPDRLADLGRRELMRTAPEGFLGDRAWRFGHALIRDAAYAGTTKAGRADLHLRFADWLVEVAADRPGEVEEVVGHHLAEAWRYRRDLRPGEDHGALAQRAAGHLARSGRRAFDRGDMPGAIALLRRAADLLPAGHRERLALVPVLGKAMLEATRNEDLADYLAGATAEASEAGDAQALAHARVLEGFLHVWSGTAADPDGAARAAEAARPAFEAADDARGLARVELLLAEVAWMQTRMVDAAVHWRAAAAFARDSGDAWEISETLALTAGLDFISGRPVDEAVISTRAVLDAAAGDPMVTFRCLAWLTHLARFRDGPEEARRMASAAAAVVERLRLPIWQSELDMARTELEIQAGDHAAAERILAPYLADPASGNLHWSRWVRTMGAAVLAALGRTDEARELLREVELLDGSDVYARVGSAEHIVGALIHLGDRRARQVAERLVAEADMFDSMDVPGEARLALARACLASGDREAAARMAADAEARFTALGMTWRASVAAGLMGEEDDPTT